MASRPDSPIKQTFKRLLSPTKSKQPPASPQQPPPALSPQLSEYTNWTYPESTSSSNYSQDSVQYTGWNVIDRPQTPPITSGANKENVLQVVSTKDVVDQIMSGGTPSKANKLKSKQNGKAQDTTDLDRQFEELMVYPFLEVYVV